jgi:hypothetical protein
MAINPPLETNQGLSIIRALNPWLSLVRTPNLTFFREEKIAITVDAQTSAICFHCKYPGSAINKLAHLKR